MNLTSTNIREKKYALRETQKHVFRSSQRSFHFIAHACEKSPCKINGNLLLVALRFRAWLNTVANRHTDNDYYHRDDEIIERG